MKEEYEAFTKALHADAVWEAIDTENILEICKGVITIFTVVQSTARRLQEGESRSKVVSGMVAHAKNSPQWAEFSDDLIAEIEAFQKEKDVDCQPAD